MVTNNAGNVTRIDIVKISAGTLEHKARKSWADNDVRNSAVIEGTGQ